MSLKKSGLGLFPGRATSRSSRQAELTSLCGVPKPGCLSFFFFPFSFIYFIFIQIK